MDQEGWGMKAADLDKVAPPGVREVRKYKIVQHNYKDIYWTNIRSCKKTGAR